MVTDSRLHAIADVWLSDALQDPRGDVVLTSPYVSLSVSKIIASAAKGSPYKWQLLTALDPSAVANGYLSVHGLKVLLDSGVQVRHVPRVHAKAFLFGDRGLLGSGNLTGAGLGSSADPNQELGVEIEPHQVAAAKLIISGWPSRRVDHDDLSGLERQAKDLTRAPRVQLNNLNPDSALQLAEQLLVDARDPKRSLWLKLQYGDPAPEGWRQDSLFASPKKGRPSFKPGDLVFICAKDTQDCYSIVEVTSEPELKPADYVAQMKLVDPEGLDRWPWVTRTAPRFVPDELLPLKLSEFGVSGQALQNGHVRLRFDQFTAGVRALARLSGE